MRFSRASMSSSRASASRRPEALARSPLRLRPRPRFCCWARSSSTRTLASRRASSSKGLRHAGRYRNRNASECSSLTIVLDDTLPRSLYNVFVHSAAMVPGALRPLCA